MINPKLYSSDDTFRINDKDNVLKHPRIKRTMSHFKSYFSNFDNLIIRNDINYIEIEKIIDKLNQKLNKFDLPLLEKSNATNKFIQNNKYAIKEEKTAGITIKNNDKRWSEELKDFKSIVENEIYRPLRDKQMQASFYFDKLKRAANFSVPGAGKTAMIYGTFAYLSSSKVNKVNKILIISPISAFESWKSEFKAVFGNKRKLQFMNLKNKSSQSQIKMDWGISNVIVVNYESLNKYLDVLNEVIDKKTMLIFDEVHRIKGISSKRSQVALQLGHKSQYKYVLSGTPIPNGYKDIYNFLHILYRDEYSEFFGWTPKSLEEESSNQINDKLYPFFWRTTKKDLNVPVADKDKIISVQPTKEQLQLSRLIYKNEPGTLAIYIRLLQASTNPNLLLHNIDYYQLGLSSEEEEQIGISNINKSQDSQNIEKYKKMNVQNMESPKFQQGIKLVQNLVSKGKKVLIWGIFVDTMKKIQKYLNKININSIVIYGDTDKNKRVPLIKKFQDKNSDINVLISNPNTLGESISLHQTVHDAIYFEYNFNLTFMLQSRDRIHRLGLPKGQYTRYYYLETNGDKSHRSYIDKAVYNKLSKKEEKMLNAIDSPDLLPEVSNNYLQEVKDIIE